MGYFSFECVACGHPLLSKRATSDINSWMSDIVVRPLGDDRWHVGTYSGYGGLEESDIEFYMEVSAYHKACWEVSGMPEDYITSKPARDQGWFFSDGVHDFKEPQTKEDIDHHVEKIEFLKETFLSLIIQNVSDLEVGGVEGNFAREWISHRLYGMLTSVDQKRSQACKTRLGLNL